MKSFLTIIFFLISAVAQAADISEAAHINAEVNARYAKIPSSCLPDALEKISRLNSAGYASALLIVHNRGANINHALVVLRLDGVTYYLNNNTAILATRWNELYDVIQK